MQASNSARAYGWVARLFHWSIALLILAARDGHTDLVEYLVKQRAKVNARNAP